MSQTRTADDFATIRARVEEFAVSASRLTLPTQAHRQTRRPAEATELALS